MDSTIHQGAYSVSVLVDGCNIQSDTFLLQTLPAPSVTPTASRGAICAGGSLELFSNAQDAASFEWAGPDNFSSSLPNPLISSVSVVNNGPYAVTVTNTSGCSAVGFVEVSNIEEAKAAASLLSNDPICEGGDLVLTHFRDLERI